MGAYEYPAIPGDLDNDGQVGSSDLDVIRANWGQTVPPWSFADGDPSGDGMVGGADLDVIRANWGGSVPTATVLPAEFGAKSSPGDSVYGPVDRNESATAQQRAVDAVFVGRRVLAEAAWREEIDGLRERKQTKTASPPSMPRFFSGNANNPACAPNYT